MNKFLITAAIALVSTSAFAATPAKLEKGSADRTAKATYYFQQADADKDGYVSKSEQEAFSEAKFSEADTNKDGKLSKEEAVAQKTKEQADWKAASTAEKFTKQAPAAGKMTTTTKTTETTTEEKK